MRILVTGASGLIGSAVAAQLRLLHEVRGVDRRPGADMICDITEAEAVKAAVAGMEAIVHVAALHAPHVGRMSDDAFRRTNVDGTQHLLDAAAAEGAGIFVLTSSTSVYGHALEPDGRVAIVAPVADPALTERVIRKSAA